MKHNEHGSQGEAENERKSWTWLRKDPATGEPRLYLNFAQKPFLKQKLAAYEERIARNAANRDAYAKAAILRILLEKESVAPSDLPADLRDQESPGTLAQPTVLQNALIVIEQHNAGMSRQAREAIRMEQQQIERSIRRSLEVPGTLSALDESIGIALKRTLQREDQVPHSDRDLLEDLRCYVKAGMRTERISYPLLLNDLARKTARQARERGNAFSLAQIDERIEELLGELGLL